jgi:hypothetical protein
MSTLKALMLASAALGTNLVQPEPGLPFYRRETDPFTGTSGWMLDRFDLIAAAAFEQPMTRKVVTRVRTGKTGPKLRQRQYGYTTTFERDAAHVPAGTPIRVLETPHDSDGAVLCIIGTKDLKGKRRYVDRSHIAPHADSPVYAFWHAWVRSAGTHYIPTYVKLLDAYGISVKGPYNPLELSDVEVVAWESAETAFAPTYKGLGEPSAHPWLITVFGDVVIKFESDIKTAMEVIAELNGVAATFNVRAGLERALVRYRHVGSYQRGSLALQERTQAAFARRAFRLIADAKGASKVEILAACKG